MYLRWLVLYSCNPLWDFRLYKHQFHLFQCKVGSSLSTFQIVSLRWSELWVRVCTVGSPRGGVPPSQGRGGPPPQHRVMVMHKKHLISCFINKFVLALPMKGYNRGNFSPPSFLCLSLGFSSPVLEYLEPKSSVRKYLLWMNRQTHSGGGIAYSTC